MRALPRLTLALAGLTVAVASSAADWSDTSIGFRTGTALNVCVKLSADARATWTR